MPVQSYVPTLTLGNSNDLFVASCPFSKDKGIGSKKFLKNLHLPAKDKQIPCSMFLSVIDAICEGVCKHSVAKKIAT